MFYNQLGNLQYEKNLYTLALKTLEKGEQLDSLYWPVVICKSRIFIKKKNYLKAENTLKKVISNAKTEYWQSFAYLYLCASYFNSKKSCDDIRFAYSQTKALQSKPDFYYSLKKLKEKIRINCDK